MIFKYDSANALHTSLVPSGFRAANGDCVIIENGRIKIILSSDLQTAGELQDSIRDKVGKDVMRVIIKAIRTQVTDSGDRITIAKLLTTVFTLLGDGFIQDARDMASAEPTTTVFTSARKTFILSEIDKGLAIIN